MILYYKQYLDKKCSVQNCCCLDDNYFWKMLGLCLHCMFFLCMYVCVCVYIYIYIYIERERERERER